MQASNPVPAPTAGCPTAAGPREPIELDLREAAELAATVCGVACGAVCILGDAGWELTAVASPVGERVSVDIGLCLRAAGLSQPSEASDASAAIAPVANGAPTSEASRPRFSAGAVAAGEDDRPLLCLCVFDPRPGELTDAQRLALRGVARQTARQLALRRRVDELTSAASGGEGAASRRGIESRFRVFMDHSPAVAFMKDEAGRYVYVNATWTRVFKVPDSRWAGRTDEELWPPEVARRLREVDREVMAEGKNVALTETVPLPGGVVSHWQVYKFPFTDVDGGRFLAGIAIDRTEQADYERRMVEYQTKLEAAVAELRVLATTDGMTQLYNRSAFDTRLIEECERAGRRKSGLAVLLIDVDRFKPFNDRFGHPAGDEVLRSVAEILRRTSRASDVVARYGGEEFAMILPDTDAAGAVVLGERCRAAVASARWPDRPVTISVGIAAGEANATPDHLLRLADQALYRSKQGGRNRVTGGESESSTAVQPLAAGGS